MNKKQFYQDLLKGRKEKERIFFRPILMHFAARFNNTTYGKFASDYKVLVESNIRAMEYFDTDMVSLISDPYRETSAFGARIEYIPEGVPAALIILLRQLMMRNVSKSRMFINVKGQVTEYGGRIFSETA